MFKCNSISIGCLSALEEHRERSECDDPRVAVGPAVLSEVARERGRRQNRRHPTRRKVIVEARAGGEA